MELSIRRIDRAHKADIRIPNQPFDLFGRLVPRYDGREWSCTEELFAEKIQMCFPDESYDYAAMEKEHIFLGAYDGETCIGLAVLCRSWNKYLYIYDLKVNRVLRGQGVGGRLMEEAGRVAAEEGYRGLWVTAQEGKADLFFYRENRAAT